MYTENETAIIQDRHQTHVFVRRIFFSRLSFRVCRISGLCYGGWWVSLAVIRADRHSMSEWQELWSPGGHEWRRRVCEVMMTTKKDAPTWLNCACCCWWIHVSLDTAPLVPRSKQAIDATTVVGYSRLLCRSTSTAAIMSVTCNTYTRLPLFTCTKYHYASTVPVSRPIGRDGDVATESVRSRFWSVGKIRRRRRPPSREADTTNDLAAL